MISTTVYGKHLEVVSPSYLMFLVYYQLVHPLFSAVFLPTLLLTTLNVFIYKRIRANRVRKVTSRVTRGAELGSVYRP